jgi:hypothetical protein
VIVTTPTDAVSVTLTKTPEPATPKKPRVTAQRLATWEPDLRWSHPLQLGLWLLLMSYIAEWFHIPAWSLTAVGVVGALIGVGRARKRWPVDTYGDELRNTMSVLAVVASVAAAAWLVWAGVAGSLASLGWLALLTAWFGGWYAHLRTGAPKTAAKIVEAREEAHVAQAENTWNDILKAARLGLRVAETRPTRAGYVVGVEPVDDEKPVTFETLQGVIPELTTKAASLLARQGVTVRAGMIRVEATEAAHIHLIHVGTKDVLTQSIPYEPATEAKTIVDPLDVGLYEDGQLILDQFGGPEGGVSGKHVGASGSGKTTLTNDYIGRVGECGDAMNLVLGSNKLVPLVYPWIKPWLEGKCDRPAIDGVYGQSPHQVLVGLAAVYRVVVERNNKLSNQSVHTPTPQAPAIVVWFEEVGDMTGRSPAPSIVTFDGQQMTVSKLIHEITRQSRSAQVSLRMLNQNDLYHALGEFGAEIAGNTPWRICLRTLRPQDGPSVLPGVPMMYADTSRLRHHSMLVQPNAEEPRVMPAKAYHLEGDDIHPVAIRNAQWRPELEPDIAEALGEAWKNRWDPTWLPELAAAAARDNLKWPVGGMDPIEEELRRIIEKGMEPCAEETPAEAGFPDADEAIAKLNAIAQQPKLTLPEPLASVMELLAEEEAPKDWVSTQQLAILLGRVNQDADVVARKEAARKLGRELAAIDDRIRSTPKDRMQGFDVAELKKVAARIARGEA